MLEHLEFGVVQYQTATLNKILETTGSQHVHGVHIYFCKEGCRCGNSQWDKDVVGLMNLAKVTHPNEPGNILPHVWPSKAFGNQGGSGIKTLVSNVIISSSENCNTTRGCCDDLVLSV